MDKPLYKFLIGIVILCFLVIDARGCKVGLGRKKREVDAAEADGVLSDFFTKCLTPVAKHIFTSTVSSVDFSIRDSKWFHEAKENICLESKGRNNSECWISTLAFLLDTHSPLFEATAQCICKFVGDCPDGPERKRRKRGSEGYGMDKYNYRKYRRMCRLTELDRAFMDCIGDRIATHSGNYSSLARYHGESIATLLKGHYSYCRSDILPDKDWFCYKKRVTFELLLFDKACPARGPDSEWRKDLLETFEDAVRADSPIGDLYNQCKAKLNEIGYTAFVGRPCEDEFKACTKKHCVYKLMRMEKCRKTCGTCVSMEMGSGSGDMQ